MRDILKFIAVIICILFLPLAIFLIWVAFEELTLFIGIQDGDFLYAIIGFACLIFVVVGLAKLIN